MIDDLCETSKYDEFVYLGSGWRWCIRTEYLDCTIYHIIRRPSAEIYQNTSIRNLLTRNFVTVEDRTEHIVNFVNLEVWINL